MKSLFFLIIFFFFSQNVQGVNKTVYIDIQYIIDNSKLGKFYKSKIKIIQDKNDLELTTTEKSLMLLTKTLSLVLAEQRLTLEPRHMLSREAAINISKNLKVMKLKKPRPMLTFMLLTTQLEKLHL